MKKEAFVKELKPEAPRKEVVPEFEDAEDEPVVVNVPVVAPDAEEAYLRDYEAHRIDNVRAIESAMLSFQLMNDAALIALSQNFKSSGYSDDPKIADNLLYELNHRDLVDEAKDFDYYLKQIDYRHPWAKR